MYSFLWYLSLNDEPINLLEMIVKGATFVRTIRGVRWKLDLNILSTVQGHLRMKLLGDWWWIFRGGGRGVVAG